MPIHGRLPCWQSGRRPGSAVELIELRAMRLLEADGRLTQPTRLLLGAASGVPDALLALAQVRPKEHNWLRFPWYPTAQGGGAFVLGHRIYVHRRFLQPGDERALLLMLAHEVGHLLHAAPFGFGAVGRARFVLWAAGHYLMSALRHGRHAHRRARIEQEAERGRWVLSKLIRDTPADPPEQQLHTADSMRQWLLRHEASIRTLHRAYPGWRT